MVVEQCFVLWVLEVYVFFCVIDHYCVEGGGRDFFDALSWWGRQWQFGLVWWCVWCEDLYVFVAKFGY